MKLFYTIILILIATGQLLGQSLINITGMVTDIINGTPIPYASVYNKGYSLYTITDSTGKFSLYLNKTNPKFYLIISSMGYLNDTLDFENLNENHFTSISLIPNPESLPVVLIDAMTAKTIVRKAIEAVPDNYIDSTFIFNVNYSQYHFEKRADNTTAAKAVRLIFADADIMQQLNGEKENFHAHEKVRIFNLLRSNVYEKNREEHGDHLLDLLEENPVYHKKGTVLNIKALNYFHFYFDTLKSENDSTYRIGYELIRNDRPKFEHGILIIDKLSFAILSIYKEEFENSSFINRKIHSSIVPYKWDFMYGSFVINFKNSNGKYIIESCFRKYRHKLIDNKTRTPAFELTECFEIIVQHTNLFHNSNKQLSMFSPFSNLYSFKTPYKENYYQKFLKTGFYFLSLAEKTQLINDLGSLLPIVQQFKLNSK